MYNRIYKHIENNNLLFDKQFGFKLNNSTEHVILQLVNDISSSFERREYTLGIFVDLSKAFDTVDHEILISKLEYYGIKSKTLKWLKSYLSETSNVYPTQMLAKQACAVLSVAFHKVLF